MKKYVFVSNSTKPSPEQREEVGQVRLSNVNRPSLEAALKLGYEVYLGINRKYPGKSTSDLDIKFYDSHTYRSIFNLKDNFIAYKNLMGLLRQGDFEVIHCNTPIGGLIGRLAGKRARIKKVIYTAHGFHFYKGAPLINNTILKWAERFLARFTDVIITMNKEDYYTAQNFKLKNNGKVYYIHGVGVDTNSFRNLNIDIVGKRKELNLSEKDIVLISTGDLIKRKNFETAIKAVSETNRNIHLLICGTGPQFKKIKRLVEDLKVESNIHFLGFRRDIKELLAISDIFLFPSYQEGLPRSLMEAMSSGLPCIVSNIRGNVDLIEDGVGGILCSPNDVSNFAKSINYLSKNALLRKKMGDNNLETIKKYDIANVEKEILKIYQDVLK